MEGGVVGQGRRQSGLVAESSTSIKWRWIYKDYVRDGMIWDFISVLSD